MTRPHFVFQVFYRRIVAHLDRLQVQVDELRRLQAETQKGVGRTDAKYLAKAFAGEL